MISLITALIGLCTGIIGALLHERIAIILGLFLIVCAELILWFEFKAWFKKFTRKVRGDEITRRNQTNK